MLRNRIYYGLKPFIPQSFRTAIRRQVALRLRHRIGSVWPIAPGSERRPQEWPGWPGNKKFALVLTHDVESAAGLRKCRELMQLEMDAGFRSSLNSQLSTVSSSGGGYVELPYTLPQDSTLFVLLQEKTPAVWLRKLDWIARHGGMALVLTHPDYMVSSGSHRKSGEYPIQLYRQLLDYIQDKYSGDYWFALPKEIAAYARQIMSQPVAGPNGTGPEQLLTYRLETGSNSTDQKYAATDNKWRLRGKRAAVLLFSYYPADPRPRRAAEALVMEGVTVDLVCLQSNRDEPRREIVNGVNVFRIPMKRHRGGKTRYLGQYSTFILRSFFHLAFRSAIRKYQFVHVHNMPDVLVFSALVPKAFGAKVILDLHDPMPELMQTIFKLPANSFSVRLLKRLEKWIIAFADLVL